MRQSTVETSPKLTVKACARKYTLIASVSSQFPKVLNTPAKRSCRRCWGPERVGELAWGGEGGGGGGSSGARASLTVPERPVRREGACVNDRRD